MAKLSDMIEIAIKELLKDSQGEIVIQRNEFASKFNCVPSQINYVLSTRFSSDYGYYVESKRGGGGHIIIRRAETDGYKIQLMHIVNSIGDYISEHASSVFIANMLGNDFISIREAEMLMAATRSVSLSGIPIPVRDKIRAKIFKNMIMSIL